MITAPSQWGNHLVRVCHLPTGPGTEGSVGAQGWGPSSRAEPAPSCGHRHPQQVCGESWSSTSGPAQGAPPLEGEVPLWGLHPDCHPLPRPLPSAVQHLPLARGSPPASPARPEEDRGGAGHPEDPPGDTTVPHAWGGPRAQLRGRPDPAGPGMDSTTAVYAWGHLGAPSQEEWGWPCTTCPLS